MFLFIAITAGILWFLVRKADKLPWIVAPFVLLIASVAFSQSDPGEWAASLLGTALGWIGGWIGVHVALIAGAALLLLTVAGLIDLLNDRKADSYANSMLIVAPLLAVIAAGPLAGVWNEITGSVSDVGPSVVGSMTGGR